MRPTSTPSAALVATLVRRDGESVPELLQRLDEAIGKALHQGTVTNEITAAHQVGKQPPTRPGQRVAGCSGSEFADGRRRPGIRPLQLLTVVAMTRHAKSSASATGNAAGNSGLSAVVMATDD